MRFKNILLTAVLLLVPPLSPTIPALAQDSQWGLGTNLSYSLPVLDLRSWFTQGPELGVMLLYNYTSKTELEVEYHHVRFNGGSLEERTFMWAPTGTTDRSPYGSPNAQSRMRMNSYLVNGIFYLDQRQSGSGWAPYFSFGSGFYHYRTRETGLIFPGQTGDALDSTLVLEPDGDSRAALGISLGLGVGLFVSERATIDFRGRYNVMLGQLRPMKAWGLEEVFPFQVLDFGIRIKMYL